MKRAARFLSVFAACLLLVAGCSSGDSGSATPSPSAASSPEGSGSSDSSSSVATSGGTGTSGDEGTSTDGSAAAPTGDDAAPDLDAPTVAWFDTFCTGLAPLAALNLSDAASGGPTDAPDPADPDHAIEKKALVSSLTAVAAAFADTSQSLAAHEPPSFDGGNDFATAASTGLATAGGQIAAAATTFDAFSAGTADEYLTAKADLQAQAQAALAPLQALAVPPVEVQGGLKQIPSCQALGL